MESPALGRVALILFGLIGGIYYRLPRFLRSLEVKSLATLLRWGGVRAKVIRQNLDIAYPTTDSDADAPVRAKKDRLFRQAYSHLARLILEIFMWFGPMRRFIEKEAVLSGYEHWQTAKAQGQGVIMLSSHVGNWEVMVGRGGLNGIDIMMVTKRLKPAWLHEALEKARATCGVRATYEPRTFRDVLAHLKKNGTIGFVLDQYAGPPVGVRVPVFGVPVGTQSAVALIAKRTGAVVLPVMNYHADDKKIHVDILPPVAWIACEDPQKEIAVNTAQYASVLEKHIRAHPEEWLWTHRRFKGDLSPLKEGEWVDGRARK